jgi:Protein of unknown function (DUF3106)
MVEDLGEVTKSKMRRVSQDVVYVLTACLVIAVAVPCRSFGQKRQPPPPPPPSRPTQHAEISRPQPDRPRGHAGDFLRRYGDLPPDEQEQALQNDPDFRRLPAARQQALRERLQHFSSLPPQEQLSILNRMETWEHLTPQQKQEAKEIFGQFRQLPPDRRQKLKDAVRDLSGKSPAQRDQLIDSEPYKSTFSGEEREIMRRASRLPLAPPQTEEGPQE